MERDFQNSQLEDLSYTTIKSLTVQWLPWATAFLLPVSLFFLHTPHPITSQKVKTIRIPINVVFKRIYGPSTVKFEISQLDCDAPCGQGFMSRKSTAGSLTAVRGL